MGIKTIYPEAFKEGVINDYKIGVPVRIIEKDYKISSKVWCSFLREKNIPLRGKGCHYSVGGGFKKGQISLNKGKSASIETRKKISEAHKGKNAGEKNGLWKGNTAGYHAIHIWIRKYKPKPCLCEECKNVPPREVANISGKYLRDINDYQWLCRKCHVNKDNILEKGWKTRRKK